MSKALADAALEGLTADWASSADGGSWCARFFRLVAQHVYGSRYDALYGGTAISSGRAFGAAGLGVTDHAQVGDALFKLTGSGGFGHVGILTPGNIVAESSSVHDGRGTRSLAQFGRWDLTVRLPELVTLPKPRLIIAAGNPLWYKPVKATYDPAGRFDVDISDLCRLLGAAPRPIATMPIREALAALGLAATFLPDHMGDASNPRMYALVTRSSR